jgi:hypothetical protein
MKSILFLVSILMSSLVFGQHEISGIITDEFGPMPSVNIVMKNTKFGTSTDENGFYSILAKPTDTLRISHIGYESIDVFIGDSKTINAELKNYQVLDEVLVNAYGYSKWNSFKTRCGFSVAEVLEVSRTISSERVKLYPNPSQDGIFKIQLLEDISGVHIIVTDLTGRIVLNRTDNTLNFEVIVDLSNQPKGIYSINLFSKGIQITSKKAIRL